MMSPWFYLVQTFISMGVFVTILLNGRDKLYGWLLGAAIQAVQAAYGAVTAQWGYLLALVPMTAFLTVFWDKLQDHREQRRYIEDLRERLKMFRDQPEPIIDAGMYRNTESLLAGMPVIQTGVVPRDQIIMNDVMDLRKILDTEEVKRADTQSAEPEPPSAGTEGDDSAERAGKEGSSSTPDAGNDRP